MKARVNKLPPIHPGEILREEVMLPRGLSQNALARALKDWMFSAYLLKSHARFFTGTLKQSSGMAKERGLSVCLIGGRKRKHEN